MWSVSNLPYYRTSWRFSPSNASFLFTILWPKSATKLFSLEDPSFFYFFYICVIGRFFTLSKVCHAIDCNGVSCFMVPKRNIISYAKIVYEGLIILEGVKYWRPLLVLIYESGVNEGKAIKMFKIERYKGKYARVFIYINEVIEIITGTLLISLNCKFS